MSNKNVMSLAWSNARIAAKRHKVGTPKEYFAECLRLAHQGIDLKAVYRKEFMEDCLEKATFVAIHAIAITVVVVGLALPFTGLLPLTH